MTRRIPMISGDEYDALTKGGRRVLAFRPGERAGIKRKFRRRERRADRITRQDESTDQDYDARADFAGSLNESYRAIRERVAGGGPTWVPRAPEDGK